MSNGIQRGEDKMKDVQFWEWERYGFAKCVEIKCKYLKVSWADTMTTRRHVLLSCTSQDVVCAGCASSPTKEFKGCLCQIQDYVCDKCLEELKKDIKEKQEQFPFYKIYEIMNKEKRTPEEISLITNEHVSRFVKIRTLVNLVKTHKEICEDENCEISTLCIAELVENLLGRKLTKEEFKVFY